MDSSAPASTAPDSDNFRPASVRWISPEGKEYTAFAGRQLLESELYLAKQIRTGNRYPKQANYHGFHCFAGTGQQLWYESLLERSSLLWLDHTKNIVAIASQPMTLTFEDGTNHTPDFIALHANHQQTVYDVKTSTRLPAAKRQFESTAALCAAVGWAYEVMTELPKQVAINLDWLGSFRQKYFAPSPEDRTRLLAALAEPTTVGELATVLPARTGMSAIYHLAWTREVVLDMTGPLSNSSLISKENHAHA